MCPNASSSEQVAPMCRLAFARRVFELPAFFAGEVCLLEFLRRFVEFFFGQFPRGEQNQFLAGLARRIEKCPIVGASFAIPTDNRKPFQTSRMTPEDREIRHLEVFENFDLECFEIKIHRFANPE